MSNVQIKFQKLVNPINQRSMEILCVLLTNRKVVTVHEQIFTLLSCNLENLDPEQILVLLARLVLFVKFQCSNYWSYLWNSNIHIVELVNEINELNLVISCICIAMNCNWNPFCTTDLEPEKILSRNKSLYCCRSTRHTCEM